MAAHPAFRRTLSRMARTVYAQIHRQQHGVSTLVCRQRPLWTSATAPAHPRSGEQHDRFFITGTGSSTGPCRENTLTIRIIWQQVLVSCPISFLHFRACCTHQCKARSAGNIKHIGKGRNAAVVRTASSRRARRTGLWRRCDPWQWGRPFPAGRALPQAPCGTLKCKKLMGQDTS